MQGLFFGNIIKGFLVLFRLMQGFEAVTVYIVSKGNGVIVSVRHKETASHLIVGIPKPVTDKRHQLRPHPVVLPLKQRIHA